MIYYDHFPSNIYVMHIHRSRIDFTILMVIHLGLSRSSTHSLSLDCKRFMTSAFLARRIFLRIQYACIIAATVEAWCAATAASTSSRWSFQARMNACATAASRCCSTIGEAALHDRGKRFICQKPQLPASERLQPS